MFAENLKALRAKHNITQVQLAEKLNVSKGTVAMWETSKREPNIEMIRTIANIFKISIDELIDEKKSPSEESENPDIRMIARGGKKMSPEQAEQLRKYAEYMFPEAFKDD